ncbi:MAG: pyruvate formate lyase family protein [Pseudomonadales bacterium]|jgi:formate C-acetyltransferase|nr:pyruvate formate lyase family protein [Pseudomonadales bacterium]MDP7596886.1 pyruvate formate lyase family protein [Pseudomonadales bacterium]HJN51711.1 pyruvate formate lyase family protein [Pseudomonadales bacterium]|tara:strand:+ start:4755 stop:7217 length:2463 start_codon:yes stop_codon:yes gene_type:complete
MLQTLEKAKTRRQATLQTPTKEENAREKVYAMAPTPRVERLRQHYLDTPNKAVIDLGRIVTQVWKETEGEPLMARRAKAFAATVRGVPINIYPDELFVGWLFHEPRASEVGHRGVGLAAELDTLSTREYTPFLISEADKRELREEIFPYWKTQGHAIPVPPELQKEGITGIGGVGFLAHYTVNYEKVLKKGLLGVKQDAEDRLARLDLTQADDVKKLPFLEGVITAMEGAAELGGRFAAKARELADSEKNAERKAELLTMAENCDQVPARPARTFYEALQSVWFVHMMLGWEVYFHGGASPGKVDRYLYPYYEADIREGRLTREFAQELLDSWFMRYSQMFSLQGANTARHMSNHTSGHDVTIGGFKADGSDGSNDLTYMCLEAMMHTPGMVEPTLVLLVHSKTPEALLIKACQLTSLGGGYPQFVNADLMTETLLSRGNPYGPPVTLETIREFGATNGCHHACLQGMESGWSGGGGSGMGISTLPAALEYVLYNGVRQYDEKESGLKTGDPRQISTFADFKAAFEKQVARLVKLSCVVSNIGEMAGLPPTLFTSALTEDCIEKGLPREQGGARYSVGIGGNLLGSVDIGNSLAAIKQLVFEEKRISMDQLIQALDRNFEGHEHIRKMCLEAPKFGNDDDDADEQVVWVTHLVASEAGKYITTYGGRRTPTLTPLSMFVPAGQAVRALPSGRLSGEPLADALSANAGTDVNGPTAVLKSVGKVNNAEVAQGSTLNMKIDPAVFKSDDGFKRLADLIRVFVDQKVDQVQFNVVSADTLRAAQKAPEEYKDLVVKVAGYNARFVDLHRPLQDTIIARTEHGV